MAERAYDIERIYIEYRPKVLGYLCGKTGNPSLAEDICSEVFIKVMKNFASFDAEKASISTWIYTLTRNTLCDRFRTSHREEEIDENLTDGESPEENLCNAEMLEALADALESLPERERNLVILRYYRGDSLRRIAERLGVSYSYAKVLQGAALEKLKKFLKNSGRF